MRKVIYLLTLTSFLTAEEIGDGAAAAVQVQSSNWQNWTFAATALATATTGILVVAFNDGHDAHTH